MNIRNSVAKWILKTYSFINREDGRSYIPDYYEVLQPFADVVFENITSLLTDLVQDTTLTLKNGDSMMFAEFVQLFNFDGQLILNRLFESGYAVICYNAAGFKLIDSDQYTTTTGARVLVTDPKLKDSRVYVMKSDSFKATGKSDRQKLIGFLTYLDNVMNSSNTTTARLGTMIMASPVTPAGANTLSKLNDEERENVEKYVSENYGGLKNQKQLHVFKQQMAFTTINLSGMDSKTIEKIKLAICVICDRIKVPSNQVAIIDSANTNSLSNGGEMREGDILKYKSYERLLNKTFINMAKDLDLIIDYSIYNKPVPAPTQPQQTF
jgi:hypothetical protein